MSLESFYFGCFLIGFFFSLISFVGGFLHVPGLHFHAHHGSSSGQNSPINFGTVAAFLAWFGGTGYLLTRYSNIWARLAFGIASVSGLGGAAAVFWFLVKVLLADEKELDPHDYDMIGVLGQVSSTVHAGGTGEMIFSRAGARRAVAARSQDGLLIPKDTEVVVTHYESGIAYVRPWEELAKSNASGTESI